MLSGFFYVCLVFQTLPGVLLTVPPGLDPTPVQYSNS